MSIYIVFAVVGVLVLFVTFVAGSRIGAQSAKGSEKTVYDQAQIEHYYHVVHTFMSREFSTELHRHFSQSINSNVAGEIIPSNTFIRRLADMTAFDEIFKNISTTIVLKMGDDIKNAFFRIYRRDDTFLTSYIGTYVYYRLRKIVTIISEATATNSFREKPFTTEELSKDIYMAFELNVYQNFDINDGDASPSAATSSREDDIQAFRRSQQQESKRTEGDK